MQTQVIQQSKVYYPQPIQKAVENMQVMSAKRQQQVVEYIELLCFYDGIGLVDEEKAEQEKPKKRQFGIAKDKGDFTIKDNFKMTEEELIAKDNKEDDFMSSWQKRHEKYKQYLDNDSSWADVRDKNDFGREPIWGE